MTQCQCGVYHHWADPLIPGPAGYETPVAYVATGSYYQQVRRGQGNTFTVVRTMWHDPTVVAIAGAAA